MQSCQPQSRCALTDSSRLQLFSDAGIHGFVKSSEQSFVTIVCLSVGPSFLPIQIGIACKPAINHHKILALVRSIGLALLRSRTQSARVPTDRARHCHAERTVNERLDYSSTSSDFWQMNSECGRFHKTFRTPLLAHLLPASVACKSMAYIGAGELSLFAYFAGRIRKFM